MTGPNERLEKRPAAAGPHRACYILLSRPRLLLFANRERARTRQKLSLFAIGLRRRRGAGTEAVASALEAAAVTAQSGPDPPKMQRNLWANSYIPSTLNIDLIL